MRFGESLEQKCAAMRARLLAARTTARKPQPLRPPLARAPKPDAPVPGSDEACLLPAGFSALALSAATCSRCYGLGVSATRGRTKRICGCVYRSVFRICLARYRWCEGNLESLGGVRWERVARPDGRAGLVAGFRRAEYAADFVLAGRRALAGAWIERAIFDVHLLGGEDWRAAVPHINDALHLRRPLDRGSFFHGVYRTQERVGRSILSMAPYSLFPPSEYFAGALVSVHPLACPRTGG